MSTTHTLSNTISAEIRAELARRGTTQGTLAIQCGLTPQAFSRRMTGQIAWTTAELELISHQLGLDPKQLAWPRQEVSR